MAEPSTASRGLGDPWGQPVESAEVLAVGTEVALWWELNTNLPYRVHALYRGTVTEVAANGGGIVLAYHPTSNKPALAWSRHEDGQHRRERSLNVPLATGGALEAVSAERFELLRVRHVCSDEASMAMSHDSSDGDGSDGEAVGDGDSGAGGAGGRRPSPSPAANPAAVPAATNVVGPAASTSAGSAAQPIMLSDDDAVNADPHGPAAGGACSIESGARPAPSGVPGTPKRSAAAPPSVPVPVPAPVPAVPAHGPGPALHSNDREAGGEGSLGNTCTGEGSAGRSAERKQPARAKKGDWLTKLAARIVRTSAGAVTEVTDREGRAAAVRQYAERQLIRGNEKRDCETLLGTLVTLKLANAKLVKGSEEVTYASIGEPTQTFPSQRRVVEISYLAKKEARDAAAGGAGGREMVASILLGCLGENEALRAMGAHGKIGDHIDAVAIEALTAPIVHWWSTLGFGKVKGELRPMLQTHNKDATTMEHSVDAVDRQAEESSDHGDGFAGGQQRTAESLLARWRPAAKPTREAMPVRTPEKRKPSASFDGTSGSPHPPNPR